ncbi:DUF4158 domain-containing protein [Nocardia gipuzkoensis]
MGDKSGAPRLGFSLLLEFFELEARFPRSAEDLPREAVEYVAGQVKVDPAELADYRWSGRTIEYHRAQVRDAFGAVSSRERMSWRIGWPRRFARSSCATSSCSRR